MEIIDLLRQAEKRKASDLHLVVSNPPMLRIDGALESMEGEPILANDDVKELMRQLASAEQVETFNREMELDFACFMPGRSSRLRCNACWQQGSVSLAIRLLPPAIPTIDQLGLPLLCKELIVKPRGLIVITGPTGSGKSTTIAAMLQHLNNIQRRYVVTIEDPIEYVHPSVKCAVSQRELLADTASFATALKYVLRQDPDVILVGEMRDLETAAAVLTVAETGHLVLSTGHAPSAAQSVERIVDLFPPHERPMAAARLASVMVAVMCQALVPRIGGGRIAAVEVMLGTPPVKNLIRESKPFLLPNVIRTQAQQGMRTLDDALVDLYRKGIIEWSSVLAFCQNTEEVEKLVNKVPAG